MKDPVYEIHATADPNVATGRVQRNDYGDIVLTVRGRRGTQQLFMTTSQAIALATCILATVSPPEADRLP